MLNEIENLKRANLYPYFRVVQGYDKGYIYVDGRKILMLGSNDYLGLSSSEEVIAYAAEVLKKFGRVKEGENLKVKMPYRVDGNKEEDADIVFTPNNEEQEDFVGFKKENEDFLLIGDAYGTDFDIDEFGNKIKREYAEEEVKNQFMSNMPDFDLTDRSINEQGEVVLTFQRW